MNRLTDMEFDEISLVTRPANQLSKVVLYKSDDQKESEVSADVDKGMGKKKMMPAEMEDFAETEMEDGVEEETTKGGSKAMRRMKKDDDEVIEIPNEVFEYISALEASNAELLEQIEKMESETEVETADTSDVNDIMKSADPRLVELIKSAEDRAQAAERIAKAERDVRLEREFVSKASTLTHLPIEADTFGKVLKGVADSLTEEQFTAIWNALASANASVAESGAFNEIGKSGSFDNESAFSPIEKAARKLQADNPNLTHEQAIAKAVESDPKLYNSYLRGN